MKMAKKHKCWHKKTALHRHRRKNYPFGQKSKSIQTSVKSVTEHCMDCNKIVDKWKVRWGLRV